jgi:hypothetical protein
MIILCVFGVVYSGEYDVCDVTLEFASTPGKLTFQLARCGYTHRVTSQTSYSPEYTTCTNTHAQNNHIIEYTDIEGTI